MGGHDLFTATAGHGQGGGASLYSMGEVLLACAGSQDSVVDVIC